MRTRFLLQFILLMVLAATCATAAGGQKGDWELGLFAGLGFPDDFTIGSSSGLDPDDDLLLGGRVGFFLDDRWSLEASFQRFSSETDIPPSALIPNRDFDIDSGRFNALYNFRPGTGFRPFVTAGLGLEMSDVESLLDESEVGFNAGGGLRWFLTDRFGLRLDGRYILTDVGGAVNDNQGNIETSVGLVWAFGGGPPADSDGDGVNDRRDKCPDTPRGATVDERGCPSDGDGDGVPDGLDKCPDTEEGMPVNPDGCARDTDGDGVPDGRDDCPDTPRGAEVDAKGCPKDSDGDGVYDGIDQCPDTPSGASVDAKGCPKDSDGDGVYDGIDKCPNTPRGAGVDAKGCPVDSDGDGVYDGIDKCPGTPAGTKVDAKGCEILFEKDTRTLVLEGVEFEFDSATLTSRSETILDRVAGSLKEWPEIKVEVAGHTDSVSSESYNLKLSERRAEAVQAYLISKGVQAQNLTSAGYGEAQPIADNGTNEGRARNRRVELKRLN